MSDSEDLSNPESTADVACTSGPPQDRRPLTRRDFLIRGNAGAVAVGVMAGTGFADAAAQPATPATAKPPAPRPAAAASAAAMTARRVTLDIDGKKYDVSVDVRESLWETLNYQLGLSNANLGCDRAQCGACSVLVDGRPMNSCALLTARLGRGQKVVTVAGITRGPGVAGLHPVQRAFWLEGGFQCGICTRGFVMASYALLQTNQNPSTAEIKEALSGNICRCGEYTKIINSVKKAAAEMRGERVTYAAPLVVDDAIPVPSAAPTTAGTSKQFEFSTALGTIEQYDEMALEFRQRPGILGVSGSERTITVTWDPAQVDEARVRQMLAEAGHPVRP